MDPHFNEYLAAVAGMIEIYGDHGDDQPTEFHEPAAAGIPESAAVVAA
jgi:hypothetical protein